MAQTAASPYFRFLALFFMCFLCFGPYFCYDLPGSLQDNLEHDLNLKVSEIMFLYSIYSWPNVVFCFLGGYVLDKFFGIRVGTSVYLFMTLVGQLMFAFGAFFNYYLLMLAGRFIFGIGCESTSIASNAYAVSWFKGKEINMVFGLLLSCARIGSAVTFLVSEPLYKWVNQYYKGKECIGIVILIASVTCLISFVSSLILGCMDKYRERSLLVNEDDDEMGNESASSARPEAPPMKFSDVKRFPSSFWLIALIIVAYYIAIFPFISIAKKFFMEIFHLTAVEANKISSIQYVTATISSPLFGYLVDKVGLNLVWVFTSIVYTISAHSILTFTTISPYIGMLLLGLSYSLLASSLWPLIALIIPEQNLGTAYGICQSIQNLGLAVFTIIVGRVIEEKGYIYTEVIFQSSLYFTLIVCSVLWILNYVNKGTLNFTKNERLQYTASRNETTAQSSN